jgi:hypothetical protein
MNNYEFILNNMSILKKDVSLFNLTTLFPERRNCSIIDNQNLLNLLQALRINMSENRHNLIYFTDEQFETLKDYYYENNKNNKTKR